MLISNHSYKKALRDALSQSFLQSALNRSTIARMGRVAEGLSELEDPDWYRRTAERIKQHGIEHLDELWLQFAENFVKLGGQIHFAENAAEARRIIVNIAKDENCVQCVKTKSMATEEIELNPALIAAGIETIETDLGEFIVQLDDDRPSHIITPMIHKSRDDVVGLFRAKLGIECSNDPTEITRAARGYLREKFRTADLAITGANFAVAQTGSLAILTNEGNGRLSTARPRIQIALMGLEKIVPTTTDLAVLLKLYIRSAVGNRLTVYTNIVTGPKQPDHLDGPEKLHLVVLDNRRTDILASRHRELLRCLRCGACLNSCPVFRKVGGHAYGSVYPGPIGISISPPLSGFDPKLSKMQELCSLCGACKQACPVRIDLPRRIIDLRNEWIGRGCGSLLYRVGLSAGAWFYGGPIRYRVTQRGMRIFLRLLAKDGWVRRLPPPAGAWTQLRDLPLPNKRLFRDIWKETNGQP